MTNRFAPGALSILFLLFCAAVPASLAGGERCTDCHANDAQMKKLCRPFVAPAGEGEG